MKPPKQKNEGSGRSEFAKAITFLSQIAITMAVCVLIGVLLGNYLDRLFGTSPWLLLIFSLLGVGASFKALLDMMPGGK